MWLLVQEDQAIQGWLGMGGLLHHPSLATDKAEEGSARLWGLEGDWWQHSSVETSFEV